ncbi:VOC family protein [Fulvivirgaceae bacterium PWU4]|uniref:VOC family protein n=1 Tax=Chryseosolibacter histidini TaxID=2782349 RepID=A0AAP2DR82_9BACT|nr:VOC family protein [Chryseosolibacter histidini]MBT1701070.1 VOC family protein [Chryseosolibacter histidini]
MRYTKIKETCLYVHDLEKAKVFYHEVLELPLISYVPGKHLFLRAGSSVLLLFNPEDSKLKNSPPAHFGGGKQHFAFEVSKEDYAAAKAEIISKGVALIDEVTWKGGETSFYFNDPEGNVLEIVPDAGIWD